MIYLHVKEIPARHIMKRWTRDARDILPTHRVQYQRDNLKNKPFTHRHSAIYVKAMEVVRLGDSSADAYETLSGLLDEVIVKMTPFNESRDGLGLVDRQSEQNDVGRNQQPDDNSATMSASRNSMAGLKAPTKNRGAGRPSSRDKAPYENISTSTRFCSICHAPGHRRTTCPERGDEPQKPRKPLKCRRCGVEGHRRTTCSKIMG